MTEAVSPEDPRVVPFGDSAVLAMFGERIDAELNALAHALAREVERLRASDPRFGRPVPAHASVLVPFDPLALDAADALHSVGSLARDVIARTIDPGGGTTGAAARPVAEIPVHYGGSDGPDLDSVAELTGLRAADVVELHAGREYRVWFLGFAPGFGYLGPLADELVVPRLPTPRERVPAGSVAIAGPQTAVYPFAMPGGWRLIGRTEAPLWDVRRDPPALLAPGDRVRFVPAR